MTMNRLEQHEAAPALTGGGHSCSEALFADAFTRMPIKDRHHGVIEPGEPVMPGEPVFPNPNQPPIVRPVSTVSANPGQVRG